MLSTSPFFRIIPYLGRPRALSAAMQITTRIRLAVDGPVKGGFAAPKAASTARLLFHYAATVALGFLASYWILWGFGR